MMCESSVVLRSALVGNYKGLVLLPAEVGKEQEIEQEIDQDCPTEYIVLYPPTRYSRGTTYDITCTHTHSGLHACTRNYESIYLHAGRSDNGWPNTCYSVVSIVCC